MNARYWVAAFVSILLIGIAWNAVSRAQSPEAVGSLPVSVASAGSGNDPQVKTRNLQVLPTSLADAEVIQLMVRYGQELGVQCTFCHAEDANTGQVDFSSDENPRKQTARIMIGMLSDINNKYLPQVGDQRYAAAISCGNCHQGQTYPPPYQARSLQ